MGNVSEWGKMYFCPTPLGNLGDITLRVLETLHKVEVIICEDTRVTRKLLTHYRIHKPLLSYRSQNRDSATRKIVELLQLGKNLAFVSDAGMPGIQDPGMDLVRVLLEKDIDFEVLPGPSSILLGVVYASFSDPGFLFLGFLPRKGGERRRILERSLSSPFSVIICESPHRVVKTLQDIQGIAGKKREVVLLRELTKIHQEVKRGKVQELLLEPSLQTLKGEIVLVVEGNKEESTSLPRRIIAALEERGFTKREIVEILSEGFALRKRTVRQSLEKG